MNFENEVVCVRHEDLASGVDLSEMIGAAFGREGLGILTVTGVPGLEELRKELFQMAYKLSTLPEGVLAGYEHPSSSFNFGWSHGRETLVSGRPDLGKSCFYANPIIDAPVDDPALITKYPSFIHPNIWPDDQLPGFSKVFKAVGKAVVDVGLLVAKQCDRHVEERKPGCYEEGKLARIVSSSCCCKARLLHYFPTSAPGSVQNEACGGQEGEGKLEEAGVSRPEEGVERDAAWRGGMEKAGATKVDGEGGDKGGSLEEYEVFVKGDERFSGWCGWHNDHSLLTGLVPGMFLNQAGEETDPKDPLCGLYIVSRQGRLVKVGVPQGHKPWSCLMFQIGETTQILSGGILQATPHAVRSTKQPDVSRESFAVFMQPEWDEDMAPPRGTDPSAVISQHTESLLPPGSTPIHHRWSPGNNFSQFTKRTLEAFYKESS